MSIQLHDRTPHYLLGKYQILATVTFTALFAIVVTLLSLPVSHNAWFRLDGPTSFTFTLLFFSSALIFISVSKKLMYVYRRSVEPRFLYYVLWNAAEITMVAVLYTFFSYEGDRSGIIDLQELTLEKLFLGSLIGSLICLGIPYVICGMYFSLQDKDNTIRLMNFGNVVTDVEPVCQNEQKITLFDNDGVLKLSVSLSNLYYIESDDNYIKVWYRDGNGELRQYMLRCRLKTVEDSFSGSDLVRCHRKYIINMTKVSVLTREKDGYKVELGIKELEPIPISKTYEETVLSRFNSR